jgi:protein SCO1/2
LVVALLCALAGCGVSHAAGNASGVVAPSPRVGQVVNQALPVSIRTMPLQTASGKWTTLAAYTGRPVLIADFMTLCEDICPLITANTVQLARALQTGGEGRKVALLEITLDPTRDTPARLRAYQKLYGAAPADWTLLRASPANAKALWHYFGVYDHRVPEGNPPTSTGSPISRSPTTSTTPTT